MQTVHIKKLEKFHPGYKDRDLIWAKIYFLMVHGDPEFELIESEIDKWRFVAMICLELQAKQPLPNNNRYWESKGFDLRKRKMANTLDSLSQFIEIQDVTPENENLLRGRNVEKRREENIEKRREEGEEKGEKNVTRPQDQKEVARYMQELRPDLDKQVLWKQANSYWDHQLNVEWRVGKTNQTVKDWRASVRTWMRNAVDYGHLPPKPLQEQVYTCAGCGNKVAWKERILHLNQCPSAVRMPDKVKNGIDELTNSMHVDPQKAERQR